MTNALPPVWSDNMPLDRLNATSKLNASGLSSPEGTDPQRFWATPSRFGDDESQECMEISLSNEKLVNHITFDVARFPHDCTLEYFDLSIGDWKPLRYADHDEDCQHSVVDCNPSVLPPASNIEGHNHPQHSFSGHWEPCEFLLRPVRCQRIRVVLKRHTRSHHPRNSRGIKVAFSLALRSFYCGYKIYSRDCVPAPQPKLGSYTEHDEISTSTDVLGSQVSYSYRLNRASNILHNSATPVPGAQTLVWRCEPQPFPQTVVNYFMDVRDFRGDPQLLDRFYIDPLYDGPNINLYYSNDEPDADFEAPDDPIPPQLAVINGPTDGPDPLGAPDVPYGRTTCVEVDTTPLSFRPGKKWWFGARLNWRFLKSLDTADHPIIDFGEFHLAWTSLGLRFATHAGDYFHVDCDTFHPKSDFTFMSWHEDGHAHVKIKVNGQVFTDSRKLSVNLTEKTVSSLRIGGFLGLNVSADFRLRHMVLKVDQSVTDDLSDDFLDHPEAYCRKPEFRHDDDLRTNNSILRYSHEFPTQDFPTGLKGGGPTKYSAMEWSPIARNYTLRKGYLQFPPTKAKYWKFEFCSLVPEPYEVYVPVKKTVKTYRTEMWLQPVTAPQVATRLAVIVPGLSVSVDLSIGFSYRNTTAISVNASSSGISVKGYSATSVRVAANINVHVALNSVSWVWGFLPAHPPTFVPRFETKCVHVYEYIEVEQRTKIAYFVGLKSVRPYKVSYLATEDTAVYDDQFHTTDNLDVDAGWVLTNDHELTSGASRYAEAQGKPFKSNRTVRAVQFATTQSAPPQLLPDDDFDLIEPTDHWREVGDGTMAPFTTKDQRIGSILRVDRGSRQPSWGKMGALYPYWSTIQTQAATWDDVERSGNPAQASGGIESKDAAITPPGGRIYAAARVIAPAALSSPLYVQLIDDLTGQVLSETPTEVNASQVTEWYTAYNIGEANKQLAWRWRDFATRTLYPTYVDSFARPDASDLGNLSITKQAWSTLGASHTISGGEAVAVAGTEYNFVDSVAPWGIFEMTVGTLGTSGTADLFGIQPIRMDGQGVIKYSGGHSGFSTTSALGRAVQVGDDIRIDVLPTQLVAVNRRDASYVDAVSAPYSLVIYLNGAWVRTVHHRLGAKTRRGFFGRLGQHFRSFSWLPYNYGSLPGPTLQQLPIPGTGAFDATRLTWTDAEGFVWAITGTVDNASTAGVLTFTSAGARMVTDTRYWFGTLSAGVRHIAAGTMGPHGDVLVLDADAGATVNALGNVIVGGVSQGNLIPGGIVDGVFVQIQFLDTKSVASSVRGSISSTTFPKMIRALVNGVQVGTFASAGMQSWSNTRRGLAGDVHDGTPGAVIADYHTSFDAFGWAPDASNVPQNPQQPTWDEVSQRGTGTYDSLAHYLTLTSGRMRARVIQRGASTDVWDMDTLSMFADPIVWSFSNDGGQNFYPALGIRNNAHGVLTFPEGVVLTASAGGASGALPGQSLIWRVVSYAPGQKVSSLTIRPWYGGLLSGITHRVGLATGGPNDMPYDHLPPIEQDARFQTWARPIPSDWFYRNRILKRTVDQVLPDPEVLLLPDALTSFYHGETQGA